MRSPIYRCLAVWLLLIWCALARAAPRAQHVFIVSFDGGKPAVMQQSRMPTLFALRKQGAGTWSAQTIFPSITLPSHISMLTGVGPTKHKVLWNDWEPERGVIKVPTIFQLAKQKGLRTAMFVGKEKFAHLFIPGTLDAFAMPAYNARIVAALAARYIEVQKPNLCFIHFADSDGAGHQYGWGSPEQKQAFAEEDAALTEIKRAIDKAGIADSSVIILSADHGGHEKTHGSLSPEDMTIPWIVWGAGVRHDYAIAVPVTTYDTAATALWLLDVPIPADWDGKPVTSAFENVGGSQAAARVPLSAPSRKEIGAAHTQ
ncbi:MAG TPA: alkaline phosphatase family protein [Chthonomonadaceae bacterium]|nr:alkaline phosphatase family protein [Chthonomonadaceae bacterium]